MNQIIRTSNHTMNTMQAAQLGPSTPNKGTLIVVVVTAQGATPIANATVTVYNEIEPYNVIRIIKSNADGKTETISLPAPPKEYSEDPDCKNRPYSTYSLQVDYQGFYTNVYKNVQIFPGILSIQIANMMPLPTNFDENNTMRVYVTPPTPCVRQRGGAT